MGQEARPGLRVLPVARRLRQRGRCRPGRQPVIIATVLTSADPASVRMPALLLFATAYGLALAMAGPRIAAAAAGGRLPELGQVAIRSKL